MEITERTYPSHLNFFDLVVAFFRRIWFLGNFLLGMIVIAGVLLWGFFVFLWESLASFFWESKKFIDSILAAMFSLGCSGLIAIVIVSVISLFTTNIYLIYWELDLNQIPFLAYLQGFVCALLLLSLVSVVFEMIGKLLFLSQQPALNLIQFLGGLAWCFCILIMVSGASWVRSYLQEMNPQMIEILKMRDQFGWWIFLSLILISYPFYLWMHPFSDEKKIWVLHEFAHDNKMSFFSRNPSDLNLPEEIEPFKGYSKGEVRNVLAGFLPGMEEGLYPIKIFDLNFHK
jgi:hypothetical protein